MKNRNKKYIKQIKNIYKNIKFKSMNLSIPKQIVMIWSLLGIISMFFPWIVDNKENMEWNSLNSLSWNIWYILFIIYILPLLMVLSNTYKEKIKLYSDLNFRTHFIIINSWLISLSFSLIIISFATWLSTISEWITYWNWTTLSMTAWILILIWWLLIRKEFKKNNSEIILEKLSYERELSKEKNNMKLPF